MNTPLILKISAALLFGGVHFCHAKEKAEQKQEAREEKKSSASISSSQNGEKGTVTYNKKEVWTGKVKKGLSAAAKSVDGKDLAAAWDGKKLVWESEKGAGKALEAERKKMQKQQKKILP